MTKEKAKEILIDFLVRKLGNQDFVAEALVNDYLNNDTEVVKFITSNNVLNVLVSSNEAHPKENKKVGKVAVCDHPKKDRMFDSHNIEWCNKCGDNI